MKFRIEFLNNREPLEIEAETLSEAVEKAAQEGADLSRVNFHDAYLNGVDLHEKDLSETDFSGAYLRGANLSRANFRAADFRGARLQGANFSYSNLCDTDFQGANFQGADFSGADMDYSCWPLWCGSLNVKIDRCLFVQLLYHTIRAGQSVEDKEVKALCSNTAVMALANKFHRVEECGKIKVEEKAE